MPKLYSARIIERVLLAIGFVFTSQLGSHGKYKHTDGRTVILPMNKPEIPIGTFKSIIKQAGITQEKFEQLL